MNIGYFSTRINTNLVINQVVRLIKEIFDSGINIILYSFEEDGNDYSSVHNLLRDYGLPFHSIRNKEQDRKVKDVHGLIEQDDIDIIHCRSYDMTVLAAADFRFCKIIFDVRGLLPYEIFQTKKDCMELKMNLAGERRLVELSDAIVCVTKGMVNYFIEQYGAIAKDKLFEIPVHYCHYRGAEKSRLPEHRLSEEDKWITFAGSLTPYYRLENIFRLFYQLRQKDERYKLLILSNQAVHKNEVMRYFDFKLDPDLFEIYSVGAEVVPYYLCRSQVGLDPFFSTVQVMNSVRLAVKTVEYIKYDLPIVAPDYYPAYKDLKDEGYPILLFNKNLEIDFSDYDRFITIKPDPLIKQRYDIKNTSKMYVKLYRRLMGEK
ncbi:MAG: glycosyltransferase [Deltaproteobacteria bacterium]|nr:glycosyltransferase [Deltaproteobacteria bacterium]MBW2018915.1 glycosyltransferase [Deltaproteobacteria bacterium]MBW2073130.1 glycosyltransferase [Deltaproteobacteria bacterium]